LLGYWFVVTVVALLCGTFVIAEGNPCVIFAVTYDAEVAFGNDKSDMEQLLKL
jgi:hypothetical protein